MTKPTNNARAANHWAAGRRIVQRETPVAPASEMYYRACARVELSHMGLMGSTHDALEASLHRRFTR